MATKVLWLVTGDQNALLAHARQIAAKAVAVRTDNPWLKDSIAEFHRYGIDVYGWRWPGVRPSNDPPNYYAPEQAAFVAGVLIPAGLDGYIADIESDGSSAPGRDWNNRALAQMATDFTNTIAAAGKASGKPFLFGLTSGFDFPTALPHVPWDAFLASCTAVYPQVYWRGDGGVSQAGGTPQSAWQRSLASWKTLGIDAGKIVPIIGQIAHVTPQSIADFGSLMQQNQIGEVHFYSDVPGLPAATYQAMQAL